MSRKPREPKAVAYEFLPRSEHHRDKYALLDRLVTEHHRDLIPANIALAWCTSWRRDVDGRQTLGQCKKASDLDRDLHAYDFVILLQRDFWTEPTVTAEQREALLDHELCHAAVKRDPMTLEPMEDVRGRLVYRLRKHDIEEFAVVAERHGLWKRDLERFAAALARSKQARLPLGDTAAPQEPNAETVN